MFATKTGKTDRWTLSMPFILFEIRSQFGNNTQIQNKFGYFEKNVAKLLNREEKLYKIPNAVLLINIFFYFTAE